jgi:hypothetical protein
MTVSLYLGAENISLTQAQKDAFRETLRVIGPLSHPQPAELMHWRTRLDGDAVLMRSLFNDADMTMAGLRGLIATALQVPIATVTSATAGVTYSSVPSAIVTIAASGVDKMRFIQFAGTRSPIRQSNIEALAYLKLNALAWGDV